MGREDHGPRGTLKPKPKTSHEDVDFEEFYQVDVKVDYVSMDMLPSLQCCTLKARKMSTFLAHSGH